MPWSMYEKIILEAEGFYGEIRVDISYTENIEATDFIGYENIEGESIVLKIFKKALIIHPEIIKLKKVEK